ncbi:hypothetical protein GF389_00395 [Candidatus Dojkabacteria bacterium]|nr:hypothetical protein [Candidatus Dojkabacteria bacterium]
MFPEIEKRIARYLKPNGGEPENPSRRRFLKGAGAFAAHMAFPRETLPPVDEEQWFDFEWGDLMKTEFEDKMLPYIDTINSIAVENFHHEFFEFRRRTIDEAIRTVSTGPEIFNPNVNVELKNIDREVVSIEQEPTEIDICIEVFSDGIPYKLTYSLGFNEAEGALWGDFSIESDEYNQISSSSYLYHRALFPGGSGGRSTGGVPQELRLFMGRSRVVLKEALDKPLRTFDQKRAELYALPIYKLHSLIPNYNRNIFAGRENLLNSLEEGLKYFSDTDGFTYELSEEHGLRMSSDRRYDSAIVLPSVHLDVLKNDDGNVIGLDRYVISEYANTELEPNVGVRTYNLDCLLGFETGYVNQSLEIEIGDDLFNIILNIDGDGSSYHCNMADSEDRVYEFTGSEAKEFVDIFFPFLLDQERIKNNPNEKYSLTLDETDPVQQEIFYARDRNGNLKGYRAISQKQGAILDCRGTWQYEGHSTDTLVQSLNDSGLDSYFALGMPQIKLDGRGYDESFIVPEYIYNGTGLTDQQKAIIDSRDGVRLSKYASGDFIGQRQRERSHSDNALLVTADQIRVSFPDIYTRSRFVGDLHSCLSIPDIPDSVRDDLERLLESEELWITLTPEVYILLNSLKDYDTDLYKRIVDQEYFSTMPVDNSRLWTAEFEEAFREYRKGEWQKSLKTTGGIVIGNDGQMQVMHGLEFIISGIAAKALKDNGLKWHGQLAYDGTYTLEEALSSDLKFKNCIFNVNVAVDSGNDGSSDYRPINKVWTKEAVAEDGTHWMKYMDIYGLITFLVTDPVTRNLIAISSVEDQTDMETIHRAVFDYFKNKYGGFMIDEQIMKKTRILLGDYNIASGLVYNKKRESEGKQVQVTRGGEIFDNMPYVDMAQVDNGSSFNPNPYPFRIGMKFAEAA